MTSADRRSRLARAGEWLRTTREQRGYTRQTDFAAALGVDKSLVSNYERGVSQVDDDRAAQIATLLRMDEVEVRRGLGLWVPDTREPTEDELADLSDEDLLRWGMEIARRHPDDPEIQRAAEMMQSMAKLLAALADRREGSRKTG